jgi:hypothetical protein
MSKPTHLTQDDQTSDDGRTVEAVQESLDRYLDCFDPGEAAITQFNPMVFLTKWQDELKRQELFICNREPCCDHFIPAECDCDQDDYGSVTMDAEIVSNCKCNIDLVLDRPLALSKDFFWRVFRFASDEAGSIEIPVMDIDPIDNRVIIYGSSDAPIVFDLQEPARPRNKRVGLQFDYMIWYQSGFSRVHDETTETDFY